MCTNVNAISLGLSELIFSIGELQVTHLNHSALSTCSNKSKNVGHLQELPIRYKIPTPQGHNLNLNESWHLNQPLQPESGAVFSETSAGDSGIPTGVKDLEGPGTLAKELPGRFHLFI